MQRASHRIPQTHKRLRGGFAFTGRGGRRRGGSGKRKSRIESGRGEINLHIFLASCRECPRAKLPNKVQEEVLGSQNGGELAGMFQPQIRGSSRLTGDVTGGGNAKRVSLVQWAQGPFDDGGIGNGHDGGWPGKGCDHCDGEDRGGKQTCTASISCCMTTWNLGGSFHARADRKRPTWIVS